MKLKIFSLTATMESLGVPLEERSDLLAISLARAIGYKTPVPAEPLQSPSQFFEEHYRSQVDETLAQINERVVFNLNEISNLVASIWLFRYRMVHDPYNVAVRDFLDVMSKVGDDKFPTRVSEYMIRSSDLPVLDKVAAAVDDSLVPPDPVESTDAESVQAADPAPDPAPQEVSEDTGPVVDETPAVVEQED